MKANLFRRVAEHVVLVKAKGGFALIFERGLHSIKKFKNLALEPYNVGLLVLMLISVPTHSKKIVEALLYVFYCCSRQLYKRTENYNKRTENVYK